MTKVEMDHELEIEFNSIRNHIKGAKLEIEILKSQNYVQKHKIDLLEKEVKRKDLFIKILLSMLEEKNTEIKDLESALSEIYDGE